MQEIRNDLFKQFSSELCRLLERCTGGEKLAVIYEQPEIAAIAEDFFKRNGLTVRRDNCIIFVSHEPEPLVNR